MSLNDLPLVVTLIVNWNNYSETRECIKSLGKIQYKNVRTILIDNGSTNDSSLRIAQEFPHIQLIAREENDGFAVGINTGLRYVLEHIDGAEFLLLLNNDTEVSSSDFLQAMVERMSSDEKIGVIGPLVRLMNGSSQRTIGYFPSVKNSLIYGFFRQPVLSQHEVGHPDSLSGVCLLVRRKTILDAGLLDENFFMYVEEHDWLYRIQKSGWLIEYLPIESIRHHHGLSAKSTSKTAYILKKSNVVYFLVKHGFKVQAALTAILYLILHPIKLILARNTFHDGDAPKFQELVLDIFQKWRLATQLN